MTNEDARKLLSWIEVKGTNELVVGTWYANIDKELREALDMAIKALEQKSKTDQFVEWVAEEIFDENWEYNKEAFAELACRKLAKLGMVIMIGDEWVLVESLKKMEVYDAEIKERDRNG